MFQLDPRHQQSLIPVGTLPGSLAFMMPDSDNPWCVLIPPVENITELHQLSDQQQSLLLADINFIAKILTSEFNPDKLNIAMLGNIVPQLHVHIIGRYKNDRAWPNPIWGTPMGSEQVVIADRLQRLKAYQFGAPL